MEGKICCILCKPKIEKDVNIGINEYNHFSEYITNLNEDMVEISKILAEKCELEKAYSKSLHQLSEKLAKRVNTSLKGMSIVWQEIATYMRQEAETRRLAAKAMQLNIADKMLDLTLNCRSTHKSMDAITYQCLGKFNKEYKRTMTLKKMSFLGNKSLPKLRKSVETAKMKLLINDKNVKLAKTLQKCETELISKAEKELELSHDYLIACIEQEMAREKCSRTLYHASYIFHQMESERIVAVQLAYKQFIEITSAMDSQLVSHLNKANEGFFGIDFSADHMVIENFWQNSVSTYDIVLPSFYYEDLNNKMRDKDRIERLWRVLGWVRVRKDRLEPVKSTVVTDYKDMPTEKEIMDKIGSLALFLEAVEYKIKYALITLGEIAEKPQEKKYELVTNSSYKSDLTLFRKYNLVTTTPTGYVEFRENFKARCITAYEPKDDNELELREGDEVQVLKKINSEWWKGSVNGRIGLFPAANVEMIDDEIETEQI